MRELGFANATGGVSTRTYQIDLALDSAFQQIVIHETGIAEGEGGTTRWTVSDSLLAETKYYWRIAAVTSAGAGPYSQVSEFRVREPFTADRRNGSVVVPIRSNASKRIGAAALAPVMPGTGTLSGRPTQTPITVLPS